MKIRDTIYEYGEYDNNALPSLSSGTRAFIDQDYANRIDEKYIVIPIEQGGIQLSELPFDGESFYRWEIFFDSKYRLKLRPDLLKEL